MATQNPATPTEETPIASVMRRDITTACSTRPACELAALMVRDRIGCIPIVDERGRPHGIVTKFDLVEAMLSPGQFALATASDVMMPLAIVLDENATIAHCAMMMALEGFHHVMIVEAKTGRLVGIVSSHDIVRWQVSASETQRAS